MIHIQKISEKKCLKKSAIINIVTIVMDFLNYKNYELTIRIVDKDEIKNLNCKYRNKNNPTNVLSFNVDIPKEIKSNYIGDVVVCAEVIESEAIKQNKTFNSHFTHIIIHGVLHLLGYNHIEKTDKNEMEDLEVKLLKKIGFDNPYL